MKYLLAIFILPVLLSSCISYHITEKDLFNSNKVSKLNEGLLLKEIYFETSDSVKLCGWFIKNDKAKGTFLYFGGNGFYLWNRLTPDVINTLTSFNMNLFLIDYRGFGRSEGTPTIQGLYNDGEAAYKYLCSRNDVDPTKIIVYGHSYGTFVALHVCNMHNVAGAVLQSPISNAQDMSDAVLKYYAPWYLRWLVSLSADSTVMNLDNLKQVHTIKQPILIFTGSNDKLTPPAMGQEVYDAALSTDKTLEIIPNGEHNDLFFSNKDGRRDYFIEVVNKYLKSIFDNK